MTPDPIEQWEKQLFAAARRDLPAEGAEQRLLAAALREVAEAPTRPFVLRPGVAAGVLVGAVLLAAAVALELAPRKASEPISAEPARAHSAQHSLPALADSAAHASDEPVPTSVPSLPKPQATAQLRAAPAAATLTDELAALKVASTALGAGDAPAALSALDHYDQVLKGSKLRAEATLLRIQALARSGNALAASALAQRFVDQNPDSPLVDRARSFIQGSGGN